MDWSSVYTGGATSWHKTHWTDSEEGFTWVNIGSDKNMQAKVNKNTGS